MWGCRFPFNLGFCTFHDSGSPARGSLCWFGERIGHADIAVAVALRFDAPLTKLKPASDLLDPENRNSVDSTRPCSLRLAHVMGRLHFPGYAHIMRI